MKRCFPLILTLIMLVSFFLPDLIPNDNLTAIAKASSNDSTNTQIEYEGKVLDSISKKGYTITKKSTTLKTSRFEVIIPKGIYVPVSLIDDINFIMDSIEDYTNMSFYPKKKKLEKVQIEVKSVADNKEAEFGVAYGWFQGAVISPGDLLLNKKGHQFALIHELTHCIQFRNFNSMGQICDEGYATYVTEQILQNSDYPYLFDSHFNFSNMEQELTKSNIEKLFTKDAIGWDGYLIGFRFMHYLEEEVGKGTYLKILKKAYEKQTDFIIPLTQVNKAIKSVVSKSVLTDFVNWYSDHEDIYKQHYLIKFDYSKYDKIDLYPNFAAWNFYNNLTFTYDNTFTIDFTKGFEYLQKYKHYKVKGFMGTIGSTGKATFEFYDIKGNLLTSIAIESTSEKTEVWGAVKVIVTGDGTEVTVEPDFNSMTVK